MRVLVVGLNGFIGSALAGQACAQGHEVFGMGRRLQPDAVSDVTYLIGDRSDPRQVQEIVIKEKIDVVVDVIPMVMANTEPLLNCLDGVIEQYVMISSSDVYANYELLQKRAQGEPAAEAVDENAPLRASRYPYREETRPDASASDQYLDDYDKIPIEDAVQQLSVAWTILRLPMVFGPGDKQRRFRWAIAPMLERHDVLTVPRSWANWHSTYGYIENVGAAVAITIGHENAYNQVFNVAEEQPVSQIDWARKFAEVMDWQGQIEVTDDPDHPLRRRTNDLDLSVPFKIDGSKLRHTLGFSDVVDEAGALERTVAHEASIIDRES